MSKSLTIYAALFLSVLSLVACGGASSPPLTPPSGLRAQADAGFIKLSWKDNSDNETGFIIYREDSSGASPALNKLGEVEADVESFEDGEVEEGKSYRYAVAATNAAQTTEPVPQAGPAVSPEPPIINNPPAIDDFRATPETGSPPLTTRFVWTIRDADLEDLSCAIDIGADGSVEYSIEKCSSENEQTHVFTRLGTYTVSLSVSDGTDTTQETTEVEVFASLQSSRQ